MASRRRDSSWFPSLLIVIGCLAVFGGIFGAGFVTGRYWSHRGSLTPWMGPDGAPRSERDDPTGTRAGSSPSTEKTTQLPPLTFYQELTAPLSASPPKARKTEAPKAPSLEPRPAKADSVEFKPDAVETFTVQVAAYATRAQAEALRDTLALRGLDAEVTEAATTAGTRYRVRVGTYPTRAAALEAATRVAADLHVPAFVAPR